MKEASSGVSRASRHHAYPRKRLSPHGILKSRKHSPGYPHPGARKTPRAVKADRIAQRQREVHLAALREPPREDEYKDDIRHYMHEMERNTMSSPESMDQQPEIEWHMRPRLVDFLVEIHFVFRLRPETLYLTINIIDRYVSRRIVYVKHYQLVGCAALWIAAKFEDAKERVPTVADLARLCQETYDESAFIQMEGHVLATIEWSLGHPTAEAWLRLFCSERVVEDFKVQHVARFLMEITLFYREFVQFGSSAIAQGALTLARFLCGHSRRSYDETRESMEVVGLLDRRLSMYVNELSQALLKKYSFAFYSKVATFVVQYYLQGGRFENGWTLPLPTTPVREQQSRAATPMSVSTTASDLSDDMPATPTSPEQFSSDVFLGPYVPSDNKENLPSPIFEPILNKQQIESTPEEFLPYDYVKLGRTALHSLNVASPHPAVVS
ncbi:hypothetical protein WOLCODRAFT_135192 [Wolfiporia cocos MD-104 SS10]|uniref:Uncharacterized protein n=1 Tax=Wolfiporia cocos (strain MD-104) TaxID=742152 RepID=A0A2H3J198_WOLCO|nr:hypothetical protein WOLCODRAFT_135192 [Wolfiporia cocos MD-104 SS10]